MGCCCTRQNELQASFVRWFSANPWALIAVSPLRPQSQQHVAVQNLSEGQGNASGEKGGRFLVIQKWSPVKDSRGGDQNVKPVGYQSYQSCLCLSAAWDISFVLCRVKKLFILVWNPITADTLICIKILSPTWNSCLPLQISNDKNVKLGHLAF